MSIRFSCVLATVGLVLPPVYGQLAAQVANESSDQTNADISESGLTEPEASISELAATIEKSLVVVHSTGRDGREIGHGTGFVISKDGLIATARHVIGDRRAVRIDMPDGKSLPVTQIHSATEAVDLVVLKVDASGLIPLPLGDESEAATGQTVVAVGHPGSLKKSVFRGIISGRQEIEDISMLQLAMTIEPGSSGEPVVDLKGNVLGLVTLKSTEAANVGFAVPVSHLKGLLADPTPIPMNRWMTIGALDTQRWETLFGADWRQRASRILVDGTGTSFGGRSLCLQRQKPPEIPYEIQVDVKLNDETGAAGLVFHADGKDRHYGFYPSNGNVRLTRFDGPTIYQWTILHNQPHPAYRPGEWNTWKVRVESGRMICYLNGRLVIESEDALIPPGRAGLAVYRGTSAEFRRFRVADNIPSEYPTEEEARNIREVIENVTAERPASNDVIDRMKPYGRYSTRFLDQQAKQLETKARYLRQLATDIHAADIRRQILHALRLSEDEKEDKSEPDLLRAALLISVLDNEDIDPNSYIERIDQLANEVSKSFAEGASEEERLKALDKLLFQEYGYRGSRYEYYTRSNSYLNEVIDDREGLPITLSVLYMELGRRLGLKIVGLGLPGHFVVRFEPATQGKKPQIIDVFNRGERLSVKQAEQIVKARRFPVRDEFFEAQSAVAIVRRMLVNLLDLAEHKRDDETVLRYLETLVAIETDSVEYRAKRLELRARTGRLVEAISDADWFINQQPKDGVSDQMYELRALLQRQLDQQQNIAE